MYKNSLWDAEVRLISSILFTDLNGCETSHSNKSVTYCRLYTFLVECCACVGFFSYIFAFCFHCLFFCSIFFVCTACHNAVRTWHSRSYSDKRHTTQVLWEMNCWNREEERKKNDERPHRQWWAIFSQTKQQTHTHTCKLERWNTKEIIYINCSILNVLFSYLLFIHSFVGSIILKLNEWTNRHDLSPENQRRHINTNEKYSHSIRAHRRAEYTGWIAANHRTSQ